jgi:tRNA(Glu) U13 pseudouridine synthase TruD
MIGKVSDVHTRFGSFKDWQKDLLELANESECHVLEGEGPYQFLALQFFLEKSSYATMFLREVLHSTTDFQKQADLFAQIRGFEEPASEGEEA